MISAARMEKIERAYKRLRRLDTDARRRVLACLVAKPKRKPALRVLETAVIREIER
jgi:ribulose bisphosphate carboxylase small subunit